MKNLRARRLAAHMTQAELAAALGVTQGAVYGWEIGTKYPSADKLPALARVLRCKIDDLYEENEVKEAV